MNSYYEPRFVTDKLNNSNTYTFFGEEKGKTLLETFRDTKKLVLLGNPGIGKTTELKNLFEQLWHLKSETGNIPFYINIKNFRINSKFEDLIPFKKWEQLPTITFILDGLDEIAEIQDFVSELELFLSKNNDKTVNIILSCRTNIYEKFLVKISEFKYLYLENLNDSQINSILKKEFNLELTYQELNKYKVYLENPFNLQLFAQFHKENTRFPETQLECWNLFIETELKKLTQDKLSKRQIIDIPHVSICLEKVAFVNELMQQNFIEDHDLLKLIDKDDKVTFEQISFIERLPGANKLIFRHKNYQEFFAAKFLSKLDSKIIIDTIKIHHNIDKTKPSLFNTITFLLNILEDSKYNDIKKWLLKNDLEMLFHSEPERLDEETRNEIFKIYFQENCIDKTFWIGKNERFSIDTIAKFANLDFLLEHITDKKNRFRSVKSAIDVLSFANIPVNKKQKVKNNLEELLFSPDSKYLEYQASILRTIILHDFHIEDESLFSRIIEYFKNKNSSDVNHQIISMLNDFDEVDIHFGILKDTLYKLYEIKQDRIKDPTIRGTEWILEKLIFKIKNPKNFMQILNVIFNDKFTLKLSNFHDKNFRQDLLEKVVSFIKKDTTYLFKIIDAFLKPDYNHIHDRNSILPQLIQFSNLEFKSFKYIVDNFGMNHKTFQLITMTVSKETVDYLIQEYKNSPLKIKDKHEINQLKWNIFNANHELGYYFESEMLKYGFEFQDILETEENIEKGKKVYEDFIQQNFDILFNKKGLLTEIEKVFEENTKLELSWEEYHDINRAWYKKTNYHGLSNTVHEVIAKSIREIGNQTFESMSRILQDDYFMVSIIKDKLKRKSNEDYKIRKDQIDYVKTICFKLFKDFNYDHIMTFSDHENESYSVYNNYYILKTLYFFDEKFDYNYSTEFYLKTLKYCNVIGNSDQNEILNFIKKRLNNDSLFNTEIIKNIIEEKLPYFTLNDHIHYAIEHKLDKAYKKIGQYIITKKNLYSQNNLLSDYSRLINNQLEFLKSCCIDIDSYLCWNAIDILKTQNLDDCFIVNIANEYIISKKTSFLQKALNILFYANNQDALKKYIECINDQFENINDDRINGYIIEDVKNFNHRNELGEINNFFGIVYDDIENKKDTFYFHDSKKVLEAIINNFSSNESNYNKTVAILLEIKEKVRDNYSKTFYINHLIDNSQNAYFNSLAVKLSFNDSKKIINTL